MSLDSSNTAYVVCGYKSWNREIFDSVLKNLPGNWYFFGSKNELTFEELKKINPEYIFFLHWSWIIPEKIVNTFECINFHMTDLPYGRGGSPLQNLILRGYKDTKLTAHKMVKEVDSGPIYIKKEMSLDGSAEEILKRASVLSVEIIKDITKNHIKPNPQDGEVLEFTRRMPKESKIPALESAKKLYDFIRMLDADGYPHAFLEDKGFRYEFSNARVDNGNLIADVSIIPFTS